jgi:hypothetical protein
LFWRDVKRAIGQGANPRRQGNAVEVKLDFVGLYHGSTELPWRLSRIHSVRREEFKAKSRRNDAKRILTMPNLPPNGGLFLMEPMALPYLFAPRRLGGFALRPCCLVPAWWGGCERILSILSAGGIIVGHD